MTPASPSAEAAYLFQHALVRDAAYELQPPGERAALHRHALEATEAALGKPPPLPDWYGNDQAQPLPHDPVAHELAEHARQALQQAPGDARLLHARRLYLHRAAQHAMRQYRNDVSAALWAALAEYLEGADRARALRQLATIHERTGRLAAALEVRGRALQLAAPEDRGPIRVEYGAALRALGRLEEALAETLAGLEELGVYGNRVTIGQAYANLAILHRTAGRLAEAEDYFKRAMAEHADGAAPADYAMSVGNLGNLYLDAGKLELAEQTLNRCLELMRATGQRSGTGVAVNNRATVYRYSGRPEWAMRDYRQALALHRELGLRRSEAITRANIAAVLQETGKPDEAEQELRAALEIMRDIGDRVNESIYLGNLGIIQRDRGDIAGARKTIQQALAMTRAVGNRRNEGVLLGNLAALCSPAESVVGVALYRQALAIHREVGNRRFEGLHLCGLAQLQWLAGAPDDAHESWRTAVRVLAEVGDHTSIERKRGMFAGDCEQHGAPVPGWLG